MRFFALYQYLAPAILFPLAYWLFLRRYNGSHAMAWYMLAIPITFSYVIPAIGMNVLRLWTMRTRFKVASIRPHHGFMFGSASSLFALVCLDPLVAPFHWLDCVRAGIVLGSVIAFWNWVYDIVAIHVGFIQVFNRPWAEGRGPSAIATDYAPALFGGFGLVYGIWIRLAEWYLHALGLRFLFWPFLCAAIASALLVPPALAIAQSLIVHGESGLRSHRPDHTDADAN